MLSGDDFTYVERFECCGDHYCVEIFISHCGICDFTSLGNSAVNEHYIKSAFGFDGEPENQENPYLINHEMKVVGVIHWDFFDFNDLTFEDRLNYVIDCIRDSCPMGKASNESFHGVMSLLNYS